MRLNTAPANAVEMNGISSTSQFKIQASAKAFSILSDGLYANKIRAIVRELSTNALDSHIAAGRADLPFKVNIPNVLAPWFSVRDYGVGLSHEEVISVYTSYFTSTKSDSDDFVGALGLGSKSPFSYTDNFSVTAIKDGRKGLYSAYIDDTGVPSIALMSESNTNEASGVEVRLAVDVREDFYKFAREAAYVYQHFPVLPDFTGESVEFNEIKYQRQNMLPGVHMREARHRSNSIVMGSIEYPINLPHGSIDSSIIRAVDQCGQFEIHVPIGTVEMSASREELSYTEHTVTAIVDIYKKIADQIEHTFNDEIAQFDNHWDIAEYLIKKCRHNLFESVASKYVKNHDIKLVTNYLSWEDIYYAESRAAEHNISLRVVNASHGTAPVQSARNRYFDSNLMPVPCFEIAAGRKKLFFVDGSQETGVVTRVRNWCRNTNYYGVAVIAMPLDRKEPIQWDAFLEDLFNPPEDMIRSASEFPKTERTKRAAATPVYEFKLVRHDRPPFYKVTAQPFGNLEDIDEADAQLAYVKMYRSETHINDQKVDVRGYYYHLLKSGMLAKSKIRLFGVRASDFDVVAQDSDWKQFDEAVKDALSNLTVEDFAASQMNSLDDVWKRLYHNHNKDLSDSQVSSLFKLYNEKSDLNFDHIKELAKAFNDTEIKGRYLKADEMVRGTVNQYPLIQHLKYMGDLREVVNYIKLIDNAKGEKA